MAEDRRVHQGIAAIRARQWYEAHELLEDPWREEPDSRRKALLHGLIHGAVALEHLRRGNARGAWGQLQKAQARLEGAPERFEGAQLARWSADLSRFALKIELEERSRRQVERRTAEDLPALPAEADWPLP